MHELMCKINWTFKWDKNKTWDQTHDVRFTFIIKIQQSEQQKFAGSDVWLVYLHRTAHTHEKKIKQQSDCVILNDCMVCCNKIANAHACQEKKSVKYKKWWIQ